MNIQTVRDNLKNTIAGKEQMLAQMEDTKLRGGANLAVIHVSKTFLKMNIDELRRILQDIEQCEGVKE